MKKFLIGAMVLGSFSSFAQDELRYEIVVNPKYLDTFPIRANSNVDGVCKHLGFESGVRKTTSRKAIPISIERGWSNRLQMDLPAIKSYPAEKVQRTVKVNRHGVDIDYRHEGRRFITPVTCKKF